MNRIYILVSLIYFWGVCWFTSLFPEIFIVVIFPNKELDKFLPWLITLGVAIIYLNKFRKRCTKPIDPENNEMPLFELYPSLKDEVLHLVSQLDIKQNIKFYINDFEGINGKAKSNKRYANVTLSKGLLQRERQDVIAILLHELFHVKHWTIHFINFEIASMLEEINSKIIKYHEKRKRKILYRYFQINSFLHTLNYFVMMLLLFLNIASNMFRMIFDEMMADKFSIDWSRSLRIVKILKKNKRVNNVSDDFRFSQHLDVDIRCWLLNKYYYHKYVRPKWILTKLIVISSVVLIIVSHFYFMPRLLMNLKVFINTVIEEIIKLWIILFDNDEQLAKNIFVLLASSIGFIWCFIKLIKIWRLGASWKIRLQYLSYLSLLGIIVTTVINTLVPVPRELMLGNVILFLFLGSFFYKQ
ncbi:hypothetical protein [Paenibacillus sp. TY11]|uniref:hypothetical protein n=1 Tax=Paenibacillus sp. TY11 TaxID=3448633 RepID=UPI00403A3D60